MAKVEPCFCNLCGQETDHDVVWQDVRTKPSPSGELFRTEVRAVQCRGCSECAIIKKVWEGNTLAEVIEESYGPPRLWRRAPAWLASLQSLDLTLKELLDEVYSATNDMQVRLLSMGVRSAVDHVMDKILGADMGSFEAKLDEMVKRGHITTTQREHLEIVIDAGSASTHRGYRPPQQLLDEMLAVMESIIRNHYITGPMLATAKNQIPPRPPRPQRL